MKKNATYLKAKDIRRIFGITQRVLDKACWSGCVKPKQATPGGKRLFSVEDIRGIVKYLYGELGLKSHKIKCHHCGKLMDVNLVKMVIDHNRLNY